MKILIAIASVVLLLATAVPEKCSAQAAKPNSEDLQQRVQHLEAEVSELKQLVNKLQNGASVAPGKVALTTVSGAAPVAATLPVQSPSPLPLQAGRELLSSLNFTPFALSDPAAPSPAEPATPASAAPDSLVTTGLTKAESSTLDFLRETTLNLTLDTYYDYNFNSPVGQVNLLRAYDVLSDNFSLNQADVVLEHAPDPDEGRRWGGRLDLQFGQATDTLQGNPSNEPRPDIYRNIFQAYGTYVAPVGNGLTIDFGKWASSLGIEGNYTKDQINYSRSFFFDFLPFYHMGIRASYPVNDQLTLNYWVVNGTNQAEGTNAFKDELWGFVVKPHKTLNWTVNYYLGQDHPDRVVVTPTSPIPVQPGLSFEPIIPAPNGRTHIFDTYATWQTTPKLTLAWEGDYEIERLWRTTAPGESSAPNHVDGGAGYIRYEFTPKLALGARAEYLSDRGGLFSGLTQALKENTITFDYKLFSGFLMRYEWRRDYSNQPSFLTSTQGVLSKDQTTATVGLIWWWGQKQGAW